MRRWNVKISIGGGKKSLLVKLKSSETIACTLDTDKLTTEDLADLFRKTQNDFPFLCEEKVRTDYAQKLAAHADFVVCRHEGSAVGYIAMYTNQPPLCYITMVSVLPGYKRCGISQALLLYMSQKALQSGCSYLRLEVKKANTPAIRAYEKFGFEMTGECTDTSFFMEKRIGWWSDT